MNAVADPGAPRISRSFCRLFRNFFIRTRPKIPHSQLAPPARSPDHRVKETPHCLKPKQQPAGPLMTLGNMRELGGMSSCA
jgi:hypothetical protein